MQKYSPEGKMLKDDENINYTKDLKSLKDAFNNDITLEAKVKLCDKDHNLILNLNGVKAIIKREDCAIGIKEGTVRDIAIISRVNKPVAFKIKSFDKDENGEDIVYLSRLLAQEKCVEDYISNLKIGNIISAKVTHLDNFGAFVDIGCGVISLIPIDLISISRISHPKDRFFVGQDIFAIVKSISPDGKICLSHKELLGNWEENSANFSIGETVKGIVRSVESYGIFIELTPNLAGLSEFTEGVKIGDTATVYIKNIISEKMKIKLVLIDFFKEDNENHNFTYYITKGHIDHWRYSPLESSKVVETYFEL
ncbi:MAG: S1 RNA-binding domain-containing protein [Oscillospiraceae bacterium]